MQKQQTSMLLRSIHWWEAEVLNHPWLVLLFTLAASALTLNYVINNLTVNTDTAAMISTDVPFQKNRLRLEKAFPKDVSTIALLVESNTPEQTNQVVDNITHELALRNQHIVSVYVPDGGDFFARNGLLYLSTREIEELGSDLAAAQPFIGRLSRDNSLEGLLGLLGQSLSEPKNTTEMDLSPIINGLQKAFETELDGKGGRISWQQLMLKQNGGIGITKRFIIIRPRLYFEEIAPAEKAIQAVNEAIRVAKPGYLENVTVYKTGEVIMEYEEMQTASQSVGNAGIASMVMVCLTLWLAYRSFRLMFATFATLSMGLVFSLGFATVAIGQLNLISISFAVLFIGMGDAYSSHFCLRYRELRIRGASQREALKDTLGSTGTSLILCTLTAAIGLYAFIPTNYTGVAELGIIAGTSMFIALATTFTVLPAIMNILPYNPKLPTGVAENASINRLITLLLSNWPLDYARSIRWLTLILIALAIPLMAGIVVDFNPTNLRDPNTDSVKTFKHLLMSKDTSPMTLSSLAESEVQARERTRAFEQLDTVDKVISILDLIPKDQDAKLEQLAELNLIMGTQLKAFPEIRTEGASIRSIREFQSVIFRHLALNDDPGLEQLAVIIGRYLRYLATLPADDQLLKLQSLQTNILGNLPPTINRLLKSLSAEPVSMETLPDDIRSRWLSPDGLYRLQITPNHDLNDLEQLRTFIKNAQRIDANITDVPVTYLESMYEVVKAFREAFSISLGAITILLFIVLKSVRDTLLVLLPLLLASLFTAAVTVLMHIPFNFANIIALPLMFGLGVDNGIHMMHRVRYLEKHEDAALLGGSESQGVFFGALTTVFSFVSLAFTPHPGMSSLGTLLALGLVLSLVCALVVLPAFSRRNVSWGFIPNRRS